MVGGSRCDFRSVVEAEASINIIFCFGIIRKNNMAFPLLAEMLRCNKEPSVTKNQDFSRHLPLKEGKNNLTIFVYLYLVVESCYTNPFANSIYICYYIFVDKNEKNNFNNSRQFVSSCSCSSYCSRR